MRYIFLVSDIIILVNLNLFSQDVFRMGSTNDFLRAKPFKGSKVKDIYLDTTWVTMNILVTKSTKPENLLGRYELRGNQVEIKTANGVGVLDGKIIDSFSFMQSGTGREFINARGFTLDGVQLAGMIEVLSKGKMPLYRRYSYYIKKPDYNPALAVGNASEQVFIEDNLYYAVGKALMKVPTKKKKLLEIFEDKNIQVGDYINQKKLSVSKEEELISIFNYYNTL